MIALPADEMLHDWMRREVQEPPMDLPARMRGGTWKAYENYLDLGPYGCALVVDNRIDSAPNDDLALGLTVIEAAGTDPIKRGSLPEALGGILLEGPGWVGMNVVRRVVPSRKSWNWGFPLRRLRTIWSISNNGLVVQTKEVIKDCIRMEGSLLERPGETESEDPFEAMGNNSNGNYPPGANGNGNYPPGANGNGNYPPGANGHSRYANGANGNGYHHHPTAVQQPRVYVTLPVPNDTVREVEQNVLRQLRAEGFYEKHPEIDIRFGSANFPERPGNEYYQEASGNILHSIGRFLRWPFKKLGQVIIWPFVGGDERHQKVMSVVGVSLYPLPGRINRVDEILHQRVQEPNGGEVFSGFGTRVHTNPPEAPETPEAHAQEEDPEPQESTQAHAPEDDPEPQESAQAHASEADPEPAAETVASGETLS